MKTVFALSGVAECGKSETIRLLFEQLSTQFDFEFIGEQINPETGDIRVVIKINGVLIGIESQGDPNSRLFASLKIFIEIDVRIIICATRTRGATVWAVQDLKKEGFTLNWTDKQKLQGLSKQEYTAKNLEIANEILDKIKPLIQPN
jgi:hypothetical protein